MLQRFRMKSSILLGVAGCAVAIPAGEARAVFAIAMELTHNASTIRQFATDNNVILPPGYVPAAGYVQINEIDPAVGVIGLGSFQPFVGYSLGASIQSQVIGAGGTNSIDSSSLFVTNNTGGQVRATVAVSGTNFVAPAFAANASGSITWENTQGSAIDGLWFNDPANGQGAESATDLPGTQVHSWNAIADSIADADSTFSGPVAINNAAGFSMSLGFVLATVDPDPIANNAVFGRVVNRGMTLITVVPEPASITLTGLLVILGYRRRRAAR